tara:strand:+ start:198 stop:326 length:129 start_codon:yes stop_codon:yes gene_type:complete
MFIKDKEILRGGYRVTRKVIAWEAVWGAIILGIIVIAILVNL